MSQFAVTRKLIDSFPAWVDEFTAMLPSAERVYQPNGFVWRHPDPDARAVQLAKAVRIASGLRAAMLLADQRHTAEVYVLLRTIADYSAEIQFLGEGQLNGMTSEQNRFVVQQLAPTPKTPEEMAALEKEYYVGRGAMGKALGRIAANAGVTKEFLLSLRDFLNRGYDGFVHGAYFSAMDLYTGRDHRFMMRGHEGDRSVCMIKAGIAGKLKEALNALRLMSITWGRNDLQERLRVAFDELDQSGEDTRAPCAMLS